MEVFSSSEAHMHYLWYEVLFWLGTPVMQTVIASVMLRRKLNKEYPFFFSYTIFQVVNEVALYVVYRWSSTQYAYYYMYWTLSAIGILISFGVIQEVFFNAFKPYEALRDLSSMLFRWSAAVLILVSGVAVLVSGNESAGEITTWITTVGRSVRLMQCGMVIFLILFTKYLGISPRHLLFGVAAGYGFYASVNMIVTTLYSRFSLFTELTLSLLNSVSYNIAVAMWLVYVLAPQADRRKVEIVPQSDKWNFALAGVLNVDENDGFLTGMERTVDRLLHERAPEITSVK
jgi:hypothetical protein